MTFQSKRMNCTKKVDNLIVNNDIQIPVFKINNNII